MKRQRQSPSGNLKPWNETLDRHLKDPKFAREYLLAAVEEGLDIQVALEDVIRAVGVNRYSQWVKRIDRPNILRAIRKGANPTIKTLARLLEPLGLQLSLATKA
jgi:DNA-binding phage protein